jgi:hypothetical protein
LPGGHFAVVTLRALKRSIPVAMSATLSLETAGQPLVPGALTAALPLPPPLPQNDADLDGCQQMVVYNLIAQLIGKINGFGRWWMLPNGQSTAIRSATPATCADRIGGAAGRRQHLPENSRQPTPFI